MFPVSTITLLHLVLITTKGFIFMFHYAGKKNSPRPGPRREIGYFKYGGNGDSWGQGHFTLFCALNSLLCGILLFLCYWCLILCYLHIWEITQTNKQTHSQLTPFRHSLSKLGSAVFLWLLSSLTDWPHLYLNFGPFWAFEKRWIFVY